MTANHKHTPGPWVVVIDDSANQVKGFPCVHSDDYIVIGTEGMYGDLETDYANARLIAAAPDLLEALDELVLALENIRGIDFSSYAPDEINNARAAIAKATGGVK